MVNAMDVIEGVLEITETHIHFFAPSHQKPFGSAIPLPGKKPTTIKSVAQKRHWKWELNNLSALYRRTFLLRNSALEFFFVDRTNVLFNFPIEETTKVINKIANFQLPSLENFTQLSPGKFLSRNQF